MTQKTIEFVEDHNYGGQRYGPSYENKMLIGPAERMDPLIDAGVAVEFKAKKKKKDEDAKS